jgi:hypothetical protein
MAMLIDDNSPERPALRVPRFRLKYKHSIADFEKKYKHGLGLMD